MKEIPELRDFVQIMNKLDKVYRNFPREVGRMAVNFSKERFRSQDWVDNTTEPWKPRRLPGKSKNNGVLIGSGALKRSIRIIMTDPDMVIIGTDKPYAKIQNEGGKIVVTDKMRKYFWAMHYKYANSITYNVKTKTIAKSKKNDALNQMAIFWKSLALAKKISIPKRKFLGQSHILTRNIERQLLADLMKALKNKEL